MRKTSRPGCSGVDEITSIVRPSGSRTTVSLPGCPRVSVETKLEPGDARVVDTGVAEHLRRHGVLRVGAPLLRVRVDPGEPLLLQGGRALRVGLPLHVDERLLPVEELRVDLVRIDVQRMSGGDRDLPRVADQPRIRVDGLRLLADRELDAHAVVDRPAAGGGRDHVVVLLSGEPLEPRRAHDLKPERAAERDGEHERKDRDQQADPPVRQARAHARSGTGEAGTFALLLPPSSLRVMA